EAVPEPIVRFLTFAKRLIGTDPMRHLNGVMLPLYSKLLNGPVQKTSVLSSEQVADPDTVLIVQVFDQYVFKIKAFKLIILENIAAFNLRIQFNSLRERKANVQLRQYTRLVLTIGLNAEYHK